MKSTSHYPLNVKMRDVPANIVTTGECCESTTRRKGVSLWLMTALTFAPPRIEYGLPTHQRQHLHQEEFELCISG